MEIQKNTLNDNSENNAIRHPKQKMYLKFESIDTTITGISLLYLHQG